MQAGNSWRIRRAAAAVIAVATLTSAGISAVGVGSAHATNWAPTYTCDTLTNLGPNPVGAPMLEIEGNGNCAASNGAPVTLIDPNPVSLAARSDGTVYHCVTTNYQGQTWVELPVKVLGMLCVLAS
jgi:hypothetical protein